MMTAEQYGNAGAYFTSTTNRTTAFYLSLYNAQPGKRPTSVYSVVREEGVPFDTVGRMDVPSGAIIGRLGPRMVAFPLHVGWNWDTPTD